MVGAAALLYAPLACGSYPGTLDSSFGNGGAAIAQLVPGSPNFADSLALQSDGKVVVGAYAGASPREAGAPTTAAVARLMPDGTFDPSFGSGGRVVLSGVGGFAPSSVPFDEPLTPVRLKVLLTGDGHVLVLGNALIELNGDGSVDQAFGSSGAGRLPASFSPAGLALAPDGAMVVVGNRPLQSGMAGAVVRLTAQGQPDPTFGSSGDGMVTLPQVIDANGRPLPTVDYRGIAVAGDGSITLAGVGRASTSDLLPRDGLLARLTAGGSLDPSFGHGGQTLVERFGFELIDSFEPNSLLLMGEGRIAVGGARCGKFVNCFPDVDAFDADGQMQGIPSEASGCSPPYCAQSLTLTSLPGGGLLGVTWEGELVLERFDSHLKGVEGFGTDETGEDVSGQNAVLAKLPAGSEIEGNTLILSGGKIVVAGSAPSSNGSQGILIARMFGLSKPPPARVSVPRQRIESSSLAVSVRLSCGPYVSCRGRGLLQSDRPRRRGRPPGSVVLGVGPFDITPSGGGLVVMPITRAGLQILGRRHSTRATLTLSLTDGKAVRVRVSIPRPKALGRPRSGAPGVLTPLAGGVSAFETDGRRYALFQQGTTLHVLDTRTERLYAASLPARCANAAKLQGLSFPMVLVPCEAGEQGDVLVDMVTGRIRSLPDTVSGTGSWRDIGRFWLGPASAADCPNSYVCREYLDWHTGARRLIDSPAPPPTASGGPGEVIEYDLDSAALAPLAACPAYQPSRLFERPITYKDLYEPPYVLHGPAVDPYGSASLTPAGLSLGRCGTGTSLVLDPNAIDGENTFGSPGDQIGAGIVSWYSPPSSAVSLYEIASGRRSGWTAPGARTGFSAPAAIAHTRYAAIVATAAHQFCQGEHARPIAGPSISPVCDSATTPP